MNRNVHSNRAGEWAGGEAWPQSSPRGQGQLAGCSCSSLARPSLSFLDCETGMLLASASGSSHRCSLVRCWYLEAAQEGGCCGVPPTGSSGPRPGRFLELPTSELRGSQQGV